MSIAITRLGASAAASTSITIPGTYNNGDIIFIMAFNSAAATSPTLSAGWTQLGTLTLNSVGSIFAWKLAQSNAETSGTWTNATDIAVAVYHSPATNKIPIASVSANGASNANNSTSVIYQGLTPMECSGTSWVISMGAIKSINTSMITPPTGLTNTASNISAASQIVAHDSNGSIQSFQTASGGNPAVSVGGTAGAYHTWTYELMAEQGARGVYLRQGFE